METRVNVGVSQEQQSLFGSSGIRRLMGKELLQIALNAGLATGNIYRHVAVGCDTRTSSETIKHAFIAGTLAAGAKVYDAGVVPTPTLALVARQFDAGTMITASHNPPEYNGIKLLNPDGSAFDANQRQNIASATLNNASRTALWNEIGHTTVYENAVEQHIQRILLDFPEHRKLTVVIDCGCGAAFNATPMLLRKMGCKVVGLNCYPNGIFPRNVEPVEANLTDLIKVVKELGADLGIAHDGDADRMMAVDDKGRFIPGDKLLAIFAAEMGAQEIVTTVDASMSIEEMDFSVTRTRVGDIYVSEQLKEGGDWGGEPSGSWIFPQVSLCPDGIYAAAKLVAIASRQKLSALVDSLPQYPILRGSISRNGMKLDELKAGLIQTGQPFKDYTDGLKLNFQNGWLLVRFSGTEPRVRLTAEAKEETLVREIYENGIKVIEACTEKKER